MTRSSLAPKPSPAPTPKREALLSVCALALGRDGDGCRWCGDALPKRRRTWCSDRCATAFWTNHWWSMARAAAKRRDRYRCRRCGHAPPKRPARRTASSETAYREAMRLWRRARRTERLEVNHVVACAGRHRSLDCLHHLENLETLCVACHRLHTSALRRNAESAAFELQRV